MPLPIFAQSGNHLRDCQLSSSFLRISRSGRLDRFRGFCLWRSCQRSLSSGYEVFPLGICCRSRSQTTHTLQASLGRSRHLLKPIIRVVGKIAERKYGLLWSSCSSSVAQQKTNAEMCKMIPAFRGIWAADKRKLPPHRPPCNFRKDGRKNHST